jgi:integrase
LFKGCVYAQKEVSLQRHGNRSLRPGFNECGPRKLRSSAYAIYSLLMAGHPFAVILCLNTTARACELKGLKWADVDLFSRIVTIQKSETATGERTVPLTGLTALPWQGYAGGLNPSDWRVMT